MKFVDVKNDVAFRKIFGNENRKEVLISFLNAVLVPGVKNEKMRIAQNLVAAGISLEVVAQNTGLTLEKVQNFMVRKTSQHTNFTCASFSHLS